MPTQLSSEFKETVRSRTDLVALVGESVALASRSGGREFVGLCPFHADHDPSLRVYPDRQSYRCWACNTGGDCFTWVMEHDKVEFREALEILARRANVPLPEYTGGRRDAAASDSRDSLHEVLLWAQNLFHQTLLQEPAAEGARAYLAGRGFRDETIRRFKLGYHPDNWDWLQNRARGKFSPPQLYAARLIGERTGGNGYYDNFVNRVLFPIVNERSQPVGFGGRVLPGGDDSHGKYWNSPESAVFHKSKLVYGLNFAREAIKETNTAIVVEGYTDCIALHQAGVANAVASLGTALTDLQVSTIKRFARRVVLVFDGDAAGQREAERAVGRFLAQDVDLRVLTLEDGQDPAEFLEAHSAEAFQQLAASAPEVWEFKFAAARRRYGLETVDGRQRVIEEMLALLASVPRMAEHIREGLLLGNLSSRLQINEMQLRERYREIRQRSRKAPEPARPSSTASEAVSRLMSGPLSRDDLLECELLGIVFSVPELAPRVRDEIGIEPIRNEKLKELLQFCYDLTTEQSLPSFDRVMSAIEDAELKRLAVWIDDQSRVKNLESKLRETMADATDGCPLFLRRSIEQFQWRREEQSHERKGVVPSAQGDGAHRMDAAAESLLRQSTEFHQRRATKRAPV